MKARSKRKLIVFFILAILIVVGVYVFSYISKRTSAEYQLENFLKDFKSGKLEKVYSYFDERDLNESDYLSFQDFKNSYQNQILMSYKIQSGSEDNGIGEYYVKTNFLGKENTLNILLIKSDNKKWKVSAIPFTNEVKIRNIKGITAEINGQKINLSRKIRMFLNSKYKIKIYGKNINTIEKEMISNKNIQQEFKPSDELKNRIINVVDGYVNLNFASGSDDEKNKCLQKGSQAWTYSKAYNGVPSELKTLYIKFDPNDVSLKTVVLAREEKVYASDGVNYANYKITYKLIRDNNDNWLIVNINDKLIKKTDLYNDDLNNSYNNYYNQNNNINTNNVINNENANTNTNTNTANQQNEVNNSVSEPQEVQQTGQPQEVQQNNNGSSEIQNSIQNNQSTTEESNSSNGSSESVSQ